MKALYILLGLLFSLTVSAQENYSWLKTALQKNQVSLIAHKVAYPLNREYPLPPIHNEKEFEKAFHWLFDAPLKQSILQSKPKQWVQVGWRGTMFNNGSLWLDEDGTIYALNYQSKAEKLKKEELLKKDKDALAPAYQNFKKPIIKCKTPNYEARIDLLNNNKFRLMLWKNGKGPEVVVVNGVAQTEGSGGNTEYLFKDKNKTYKVFHQFMGEDDFDFIIEVEEEQKHLWTEKGYWYYPFLNN